MSYSSEKFVIKAGSDYLNRQDFEYWPAWSEHYDYDEILDIQSWGVDKQWALAKFSDYDTGGPHPHYTILNLERLPLDNMRIFLKAVFEHSSGAKFNGYIMNEGDLCITIFSESVEYNFSNHPLFKADMDKQARVAETDFGIDRLFPLHFTTQFKNRNGNVISGIYNLTNQA